MGQAHVLVTGAAGGIGAAIVQKLLAQGANVTATDLPPFGTSGSNFGSTQCAEHTLDVTDTAQIAELTEMAWKSSFGPVDALVNAAGVFGGAPGVQTSDKELQRLFSINAFGVFAMCRALGSKMAERGHGSIVTVGSNAGSLPRTNMVAYGASKAAASSITRSFGLELGRNGVRCNVVCPGTTRTPMIEGLDSEEGLITGDQSAFKTGIPLGRIAEPNDIAEVVVFLTSTSARHVTLQEVVVDGGASQR
ncbi:SDR family oxidoreductase [Corynebacterium sp.]|uniref:SDR family oxidoreductase n=1 Tax=Corynebacterium sp. TaxID=1720 RepID=UPI002647CF7D|nr:SDR family oxidoreductase [Corynebacterium sp.]MDN6136507.1 SDR family oxidoreductase [Corynebacterium sp.]MDN6737475.1 SDR family oxidoreductase [Corynebacterium sp.]